MNLKLERAKAITRRHFFGKCQTGIGVIALDTLLSGDRTAVTAASSATDLLEVRLPHYAPKAKNIIYLHMAGSPPQHELFDWKPKLVKHNGEACPDEFYKNQRFAFISGHPKLLGCPFTFKRYGRSGAWVSELLPHFSEIVDEVAIIKSLVTKEFNHAPAQFYVHTGEPSPGYASIGSWVTYGLGSENQNLPGFVVLVSGGAAPSAGKSIWGSGFLPTVYQGVQCRTSGDPVLYLSNPKGMNRGIRRDSLDALRDLNEFQHKRVGDAETLSRIAQYELAFRMQIAVPGVMDIAQESKKTQEMYGVEPGKTSFANNCLLARRLVESGVRFVQIYDWGWDVHGNGVGDDLITQLPKKCRETDRPTAALVKDLKTRGLLDETLVVWSGEFGRTSMKEQRGGPKYLGRDHHPHCFTIWMAGGGVKPGFVYGKTDELGFFVTEGKTTVHDLQATLLHLVGLDPHRLSYPFRGLDQRLIGPSDEPRINRDILI